MCLDEMKRCIGCGEERPISEFYRGAYGVGHQSRCKACFRIQTRAIARANPERYLWYSARSRASSKGVPFSILPADIIIPDLCPCCKIPLSPGERTNQDLSPSLDRIVPGLGYTPENTIIICFACNRRKNDSTPEQLYAIADYVYRLRKVRGLC